MEEGKIGTTTCIHMEIIHAYQRTSTVTDKHLCSSTQHVKSVADKVEEFLAELTRN